MPASTSQRRPLSFSRPAARVDARRLECGHELLETLTLHGAEEAIGANCEAVEGDLVLPHAAVAEHLYLGAPHADNRERVLVRPARLPCEEDRQATVARIRRAGAHEHGHQVGARGVGDPGLVPGDAVDSVLPHRSGANVRKIGARVRLGEHRGGQHLARGDARQPSFLLCLGAGAADELRGNFGARGKRPNGKRCAR